MPTGNMQPAGLVIMKAEDSPETTVQPDTGFYRRWSEKKQASRQPLAERDESDEEQQQPGDEDMPTLESLDENSDYSGFLSPRVSDQLRQVALRKLFHSAAFNVCDGLDDYAEDFTSFEKLGDVMTADLRHRLEQEAHKQQVEADESAERDALESDVSDDEASDEPAAAQTGQNEDPTNEAET
ncbi:MAG: DUF3306 domain-containing protein [Candidatus Thiodiazotropha sp. (ex Codakia orbicularis)]|nr:DUF3306 domain-containing protein [Candidatus Thiodiazotropha sp. (ex Codakia orbicularis)]